VSLFLLLGASLDSFGDQTWRWCIAITTAAAPKDVLNKAELTTQLEVNSGSKVHCSSASQGRGEKARYTASSPPAGPGSSSSERCTTLPLQLRA
jgi:hypothetical protein